MGCLFELISEIIFEGTFDLIGYCYIKLMQLIVPDKTISEKAKEIIKKAIKTVASLLAIIIIIGFSLLIQEDPVIKNVGKYMTYIPLTIIGLQIFLGILVRIISHFKK